MPRLLYTVWDHIVVSFVYYIWCDIRYIAIIIGMSISQFHNQRNYKIKLKIVVWKDIKINPCWNYLVWFIWAFSDCWIFVSYTLMLSLMSIGQWMLQQNRSRKYSEVAFFTHLYYFCGCCFELQSKCHPEKNRWEIVL